MRIFVTGGTGFLGSHFLNHALTAGHEVVALRRPDRSSLIPLKQNPKWVETALDQVPFHQLEGCEALVHFAAQGVSPQPTDWNQAFETNVRQSLALFVAAEKAGIPHLIASGSCFEYGKSAERYDPIPPDAPLEPIGPYAASKAAFSLTIEAMAKTSTAAFTILRPFHLFGEGQHQSNLWPSLRIAARAGNNFPMTAGEQIRDYLPVEKAAQRFLKTAEALPPPGGINVCNLGSGQPVSLRDFASYWWKEWNAAGSLEFGRIAYRPNEIMRFIPKI